MKKYLVLLFFCFSACETFAQIGIQPVLPLAGIIQKANLWNLAIVNTSAGQMACRLELTLTDRASGMEVLTATTGQFLIGTGSKQVNAALLMPIQYNYISSALSARTDELIPVGNYTACYHLTANKNVVAEECISFDVEPLSPPMLVNPADSSQLDTKPSQFTWITPAPMNLFSRLQYEVNIVEILPGQKPEEAIQQNLPFYTEPNVPVNNLTYRGMATDFENEKWYAWQVVAKDDNNYAGKSEVFVFKINETPVLQNPDNSLYLLLEDNSNGSYQIPEKKLHIKYFSRSNDYETEIRFKNERGRTIKTIKQKISQGENYFDFNLTNSFHSGDIYSMNFTDANNLQHTLTFSINNK